VCSDCEVLEHAHVDHDITTIEQACDALALRLRAVLDKCQDGIPVLLAGYASVAAAHLQLAVQAAIIIEDYDHAVEAVVTAIRSKHADVKREVAAKLASRDKALDAQCDELLVSARQLDGAIITGNAAIAGKYPVTIAQALESCIVTSRLVRDDVEVCTPTYMKIVHNMDGVLAAIGSSAHVRILPADPSKCTLDGPGMTQFIAGWDSETTLPP